MGVQLGSSGQRRGRRKLRPMGEINVTPFVDVMLVLLIVFMVTAPLLTVGVPVELPKTKASQISDDQTPMVVTIKPDGEIALQNRIITIEELVPRLEAVARAKPDTRVFVRGDKKVAYGEVIEVMGRIQEAGFSRVALITKLPEEN
ncbi:MAG: protein TolR [Alphaproteobacteria bacterium]|jgi:biopolymer transport protein TolR|nr:protein TolR [Alphaproteobacteria bacterium]